MNNESKETDVFLCFVCDFQVSSSEDEVSFSPRRSRRKRNQEPDKGEETDEDAQVLHTKVSCFVHLTVEIISSL